MTDPLLMLKQFILAVHPLPEALLEEFLPCWEPYAASRKQLLTRPGDTEQYLYFVLEGVQRAVVFHDEREYTLVFSYAPSFSGIIDSLLNRTPSRYALETLTAGRFLRLHHEVLQRFAEGYPELEHWLRLSLSRVLEGTLERQAELLAFSAEEKFLALLRRSPHLLQLVPHKYLASYIGVDPTNFSRMLGNVRL